jgi:hypothetical protein
MYSKLQFLNSFVLRFDISTYPNTSSGLTVSKWTDLQQKQKSIKADGPLIRDLVSSMGTGGAKLVDKIFKVVVTISQTQTQLNNITLSKPTPTSTVALGTSPMPLPPPPAAQTSIAIYFCPEESR